MKKILYIAAFALIAAVSCEKSFDVDNTGNVYGPQIAEKVEQDPSVLSSYVGGLYSWLTTYGMAYDGHDDYGLLSVMMNLEYMGNDIAMNGTQNWGTYDYNHDYGQEQYIRSFQNWTCFYTLINKANAIINFFPADSEPDNPDSRGFLGQAYALRAFAYTNLIYIFQDPVDENGDLRTDAPTVPIVFATRDGVDSETVTASQGRNPMSTVMAHIEENIAMALPLLEGYVRPNKNEVDYSVAQGIAARYYLLTQQWEKAAEAAAEAMEGYTLMDKDRLYSGFMELNDTEVMWGFNHSTETQTAYASFFSHMSNECAGYSGIGQMIKCIDAKLYSQIPETDFRKGLFNTEAGDPAASQSGGQYPYASRKFGFADQWLQDYIYMRAAEMILIKAEAEARLGNNGPAATTLKVLMAQRDPGFGKGSVTVEDVLLQRRIELWGEGFHYFDLRRNGLGTVRNYEGSNHPEWARKDFAPHALSFRFQIPLREIQENTEINEEDQNEWTL